MFTDALTCALLSALFFFLLRNGTLLKWWLFCDAVFIVYICISVSVLMVVFMHS